MYEKYRDQVAFFVVYISEAHTSDTWQDPDNLRDKIVIAMPASLDERDRVADACVRNLKIPFPALLDDLRNSTETAYAGWPDRLYAISREGRIAFKSRPGPFGFKPAELAAAVTLLIGGEQLTHRVP